MMMTAFLQEAFSHFGKETHAPFGHTGSYEADRDFVTQAIERVVDETLSRLRAVPSYRRRLEGPVIDAFIYIDETAVRHGTCFLDPRRFQPKSFRS